MAFATEMLALLEIYGSSHGADPHVRARSILDRRKLS
jgi:hypothetical protein